MSQNLTTLAMDKEYKIRRAKRKEARGESCTARNCPALYCTVRVKGDEVARNDRQEGVIY